MKFLEYNMGEGVRAFSTTREGGVGIGAYAGFNITHYCGDEAEAVAQARSTLCNELGISIDRLIVPRQTHSSEVLCIDDAFLALSKEEQSVKLYAKDAVVTALPKLCIGVSTADCVPILLYDTKKNVIAAIHAGWRGTVARIVEKCVTAMSEHYDSSPVDIRAVIGPSISLQAFEVGDEVYDTFAAASFPMQQIAFRMGEKWHIDLWEANRLQLLDCGVPATAVEVCGICTYTNCDEFFSARRLGINSGRIYSGILIRSKIQNH